MILMNKFKYTLSRIGCAKIPAVRQIIRRAKESFILKVRYNPCSLQLQKVSCGAEIAE